MSRGTAAWVMLAGLACGQIACGAGVSSAPSDAGANQSQSLADRCLAIANAKHDRRRKEPDAVTVSHILVKYDGAKSPKAGVSRSRGEGCLRASEAQRKLGQGADFTALVGEYSDSPGANRDGALGSVHRADLEQAFADAAFQLERGQMSDVVETPFGFHVIVRTE